jgi:hypothetical protein
LGLLGVVERESSGLLAADHVLGIGLELEEISIAYLRQDHGSLVVNGVFGRKEHIHGSYHRSLAGNGSLRENLAKSWDDAFIVDLAHLGGVERNQVAVIHCKDLLL